MPISPDVTLSQLGGCHFERDTCINKLPDWTPKEIENLLHENYGIVGQDAAVRAASLIVYNHFEDRPSVSLFCGPTGAGKTEIW